MAGLRVSRGLPRRRQVGDGSQDGCPTKKYIRVEDCLFEEGCQRQIGIRGVDGGVVRNCVTPDEGRDFRSFNGVHIGAVFVAPIVPRSTRKARLFIVRTASGSPEIAECEAYNDRSGGIPITADGLPK